jgi:hypothetical protein
LKYQSEIERLEGIGISEELLFNNHYVWKAEQRMLLHLCLICIQLIWIWFELEPNWRIRICEVLLDNTDSTDNCWKLNMCYFPNCTSFALVTFASAGKLPEINKSGF